MQTQIEVPLSQLKIDPANVRSESDLEPWFLASISEKGVIQALIVRKNGDGYLVTDGGKRLAALHALSKRGAVNGETMVRVDVREDSDIEAADTSLTTNYIRSDMHPADEFEAFAKLQAGGMTRDDIRRRYGLTAKEVDQVLALGALSPGVRAAWKADRIREESVQAFTLESDHARQDAILKKLGKYPNRWQVKSAIVGEDRDHGKFLAFVTTEAYEAAGGKIVRDLFAQQHETASHITDGPLLMRLSEEKLKAECDKLIADGWRWAEVDDNNLRYQMSHLDQGKKRTNAEKPNAGCLIFVERDGKLGIEKWLVKSKAATAAGKATATKKAAAKRSANGDASPAISAALAGRLSEQITTAAESVLALDSNLGLAVIAAALTSDDGPACITGRMGGGDEEFAEQLVQFRKKPVDQLIRILAGLAAATLNMGGHVQNMLPLADDRAEDRALLEALDPKKLNAQLRTNFDAADYFAGVTAQACKDAITLCDPKQPITGKEKKSELAKLAADLVKKSNAGGKAGYLPPEMRTAHYDGPKAKAVAPVKAKAAKKKAK